MDVGVYRYGFNGKENDNEIKGEGNQQDYGMRIYDPRLGRFLSVDPLAQEYAFYTPYQFAGNKPIMFIDLDGNEVSIAPINKFKYGDNILLNAINVVNNGAINVMNTGIGLINSTAYVGYSVANKSPSTIGKEIKSEFQELGSNIAQATVSQYTYVTKTPWKQQLNETGAELLTADAWEQASTLAWGFAVSKMDFRVPAPKPGTVRAGFSTGAAEEAAESGNILNVPGRVQSRINITNKGWKHILDRHFGNKNASQFTISQDKLRGLLSSEEVVKSPIIGTLQADDGLRYVREVSFKDPIGLDKYKNLQPTSTMTILTNEKGELQTATPGTIGGVQRR